VEDIEIYRQSGRYRTSAWLLVLGRFGVIALLPVFALLFWFPRNGRFIHPPPWWDVMFFGILGMTVATIGAGAALAALMKCDRCGRRPTIVWDLRKLVARRQSEWVAIRDHFFPPELRSGVFQCAHCKTRFRLRARTQPP
jgi:hypothetical protein